MTIRMSSLQKITGLKNRLTQQASVEYSESLRALETEQMRLQELMQQQDQAIFELHNRTTSGVASHELHDWMQFLISQRNQIDRQHRMIERKKEDCTDKRSHLTDRFMDEQKWIKLQERRKIELHALMNKQEQEQLDEVAVTGHSRVKEG